MDNSLKRSFPLQIKEEKEKGCGCGCNDQAEELREAFSQEEGVTSFLKEQKNPFTEEEGEEEEEMPPEMEDEEEMEEETRGAVEDVLAELNDDYGPSRKQRSQTDRGAVEDVLRSLNSGNTDGYGLSEEDGDVPEELEDNQFEAEDEEDEEEEMDEVVASVLDELNDGQQGLREDWQLNEDDPCWDGYTMVGMKQGEGGEEVPNCVPEEDAEDYDPDESTSLDGDALLDSVLEDQVNELSRLDQLAEQVLNE
jgi:hypothetical protein